MITWYTKTRNKEVVKACMRRNGNFVILNKYNGTVWSSHTQEGNAGNVRTCIQDDGQLVVAADDKALFASGGPFQCL